MDENATIIAAIAFACYAGILLWIAVSDLRSYRIPNLANAALLLLFVPTGLLLPVEVDWLAHGGAALVVLVVTFVPFSLGWLGAGDVKMFTSLAFWSGFSLLVEMLFLVSLAGGTLAGLLIVLRLVVARFRPAAEGPGEAVRPRVLDKGAKMPYGAAISAGALVFGLFLPQFRLLFG